MSRLAALQELQSWYRSQCNGDWEHTYGVKIETLDNPGWTLSVDLSVTALESRSFARISHGTVAHSITDDGDWLACEVKDGKFVAAGGPEKLEQLIQTFLSWAYSDG
jgi:hypothetical protein